jgi:predicted transcriptional regulator
MTKNMSERLFNALVVKGETLTPAQITSRFGLAKPRNAVMQLREEGYSIYTNHKKNSRGEIVTTYRYGRPSRAMVAAAYKAKGAQVFA